MEKWAFLSSDHHFFSILILLCLELIFFVIPSLSPPALSLQGVREKGRKEKVREGKSTGMEKTGRPAGGGGGEEGNKSFFPFSRYLISPQRVRFPLFLLYV